MEKQLKHLSKFMSLVLRHKPETIGLTLDENGWAGVNELIEKLNKNGAEASIVLIQEVVATNDKKRFAFNEDQTRIRASQGHSIAVELHLKEMTPPEYLYHGTAERFLDSILATGLQKQGRQHVHLSTTTETAKAVGGRHGKPVILLVNAKEMHEKGYTFYLSENNVWLTEQVPVGFIGRL
jgi:putative RNA 2'-phosphotransferase